MSTKNIQGSIDLLKMERSCLATIKGLKCLIIPVEENGLYVSKNEETGKAKACYLNLSILENKEGVNQFGNSHYCKQGMSNDFMESNPEIAKRKKETYLGNFKPLIFDTGNQAGNVMAPEISTEVDDELPF